MNKQINRGKLDGDKDYRGSTEKEGEILRPANAISQKVIRVLPSKMTCKQRLEGRKGTHHLSIWRGQNSRLLKMETCLVCSRNRKKAGMPGVRWARVILIAVEERASSISDDGCGKATVNLCLLFFMRWEGVTGRPVRNCCSNPLGEETVALAVWVEVLSSDQILNVHWRLNQ